MRNRYSSEHGGASSPRFAPGDSALALLEKKVENHSLNTVKKTHLCREDKSIMQLEGKVALVTGGSLGIGEAIARAFGHAGARITVDYLHHQEPAERLCQEIGQDKAMAIQADVSKIADIERLVQATVERFGRLD